MTIGDTRTIFTIEDARTGRLRVDDRADFTYQPKNSLEVQIDVLGRALKREHASLIDWLLPEANAIAPVVVLAASAGGKLLLTGVVAAGVSFLVGNGGALIQQAWCPGRTKKDSYFTASYCEKYFDWVEANNKPSDRVPNKDEIKPPAMAAAPTEPTYVVSDCANSSYTSTTEDGVKTTMQMQFKEKKADKIMVTQTFPAAGGKSEKSLRLELALDENNLLLNMKNASTGDVLGTNDLKLTQQMTPTVLTQNLEQTKKGANLVSSMITFLKYCKDAGEKEIAAKAAAPADIATNQVPTPALIPPVMPTTAPTTAPTSTK